MFVEFNDSARNEALESRLRHTTKITVGLFAEVLTANPRLMSLKAMGKTVRLDRLIASEAWTDAALELIGLEIPSWRIKRLCLDDGAWICTLTRFPDLPDWLDDSAESRHAVLPLAILGALVEIRGHAPPETPQFLSMSTAAGADLADYR